NEATTDSREKGFTLIENMFALAILCISLLGLSQLVGVSVRQSTFARNNTMALTVVQMTLEELRVKYNSELETETASSDLTAGSHTGTAVMLQAVTGSAMGNTTFQVSWEVTISGAQKTLTVTVVPDIQNELTSKSLSITTVFAP
ncbi:type II secretion system GspH family protein, partial [Acidobacteria bacterium AH-259-D05]|nr:type II secretion system GspH family protein [Acidobacteria bacterium AH-259-D05]